MDKHLIEQVMNELIAHQEKVMMKLATKIHPHLTQEDLLQPNDFPQLENHPLFRYEEGVLAGIHTARMALRAHLCEHSN